MRKASAALALAALALVVPATRAEAANTEIHILNGAPNPDHVVVNAGDTVTFANDDDVSHQIWAAGEPRGDPIPPHTVSGEYSLATSGQGATFDYQIDQDGASGQVIVGAPPATEPPPTEPPATQPPATTATTVATTTTSTTTTTTSTTSTTTTTVASSSSSSSSSPSGSSSSSDSTGSSSGLAVLGVALLVAGFGGMVIATTRKRGP